MHLKLEKDSNDAPLVLNLSPASQVVRDLGVLMCDTLPSSLCDGSVKRGIAEDLAQVSLEAAGQKSGESRAGGGKRRRRKKWGACQMGGRRWEGDGLKDTRGEQQLQKAVDTCGGMQMVWCGTAECSVL
eukprot:355287-Chlamydomonas_euryale.AAC.1